MKKTKNMLLMSLILMCSTNLNAADESQGKWYRFTSDFISNCIKTIEDSKKEQYETNGKTVSGVNAPVLLSTCISSSPYLDTESQITQPNITKGCGSIDNDLFLLPTGSNNQLIEVISKDNNVKSTFLCTGSSWTIQSAKTVEYEKENCSATGVVWGLLSANGGSYGLTRVLSESSMSRDLSCFNNLPQSDSGKSIILKSVTDMGAGKIKFTCEDGEWVKNSDSVYPSTCQLNYCQSNTTVNWFDSRITDYQANVSDSNQYELEYGFNVELNSNSMEEDLNSLKSTLSNYNITKEELSSVMQNVVSNLNYDDYTKSLSDNYNETVEQLSTNGTVSTNAFESDPNLKGSPFCIEKVKSTDGGKTGVAEYYKNDKRLFLSESIAREESNIIEGKAYFKCSNGKWEVDSSTTSALCQRKTNFTCERIEVVKISGNYKYMYQCGIR